MADSNFHREIGHVTENTLLPQKELYFPLHLILMLCLICVNAYGVISAVSFNLIFVLSVRLLFLYILLRVRLIRTSVAINKDLSHPLS